MFKRTTSFITALFTLLAFMLASQVSASQLNEELTSVNAELHHSIQVNECPSHLEPDHSNTKPHDTCSTVCLLKVPCGQSVEVNLNLNATLVLISTEPSFKAIVRAQSLFRPPIS